MDLIKQVYTKLAYLPDSSIIKGLLIFFEVIVEVTDIHIFHDYI